MLLYDRERHPRRPICQVHGVAGCAANEERSSHAAVTKCAHRTPGANGCPADGKCVLMPAHFLDTRAGSGNLNLRFAAYDPTLECRNSPLAAKDCSWLQNHMFGAIVRADYPMSRRRKIVWAVILLITVAFAASLIPVYGTRETFTEVDRNMIRLKELAVAVHKSTEATGEFPDTLESLIPVHLNSDRYAATLYRDAVSKRTYDWLYFVGPQTSRGDSTIIAASPSSQLCPKRMMHHRIVAYADGRVLFRTDEQFRSQLAEQRSKPHK
jgi:hypothetical protein